MPTEPENKIEELLKAYAKKRREEAGAPLEMHPATRRLLQAEVARGQPAAEPPSFLQLLVKFWPRIAFAASAVALVGVLIWVSNPQPTSRLEMAQNVKEPANFLTDRDQAKDSPATSKGKKAFGENGAPPAGPGRTPFMLNQTRDANQQLKGEQMSGGGFSAGIDSFGFATAGNSPATPNGAGGGAQRYSYSLGLMPTNSPAAQGAAQEGLDVVKENQLSETQLRLRQNNRPAQPPSGQTALAYAPAEENLARKLDRSKTTPPAVAFDRELDKLDKKAEIVDQPQPGGDLVAAAKPQSTGLNKQFALNDETQGLRSDRVHFSQITEAPQGGHARIQGGSNLLSSFELEQNGDRIRIYDADGSVYEGRLVATVGTGFRMAGLADAAEKAKRALSAPEPKPGQQAAQVSEPEAVQQKSFFQASGTNRSLNQLVVINGAFISAANAEAKSEANLPALRGSGPAPYNGPVSAAKTAPAQPATPVARFQFFAPGQSSGAATPAPATIEERRLSTSAPVLRIQGTANIGATNEVEINAIRAPR